MILTGRHLREGRFLTGMSQVALAVAAGVGLEVVIRAELGDGLPMITVRDARALRAALEAADIEFLPANGSGSGVRLRKGSA